MGLEVGRVLERGEEEELVRLLVWEVEEWRMMVIERPTTNVLEEEDHRSQLERALEEEERRGCDEGGKEEVGGCDFDVLPSEPEGIGEDSSSSLFEPAPERGGCRCSILRRG